MAEKCTFCVLETCGFIDNEGEVGAGLEGREFGKDCFVRGDDHVKGAKSVAFKAVYGAVRGGESAQCAAGRFAARFSVVIRDVAIISVAAIS